MIDASAPLLVAMLASVRGYDLEIALNDVPLLSATTDGEVSGSRPVTGWVFQGPNELRFTVLRAAKHPDASDVPPRTRTVPAAGALARAALIVGPRGVIPPADAPRLVSMEWSPRRDEELRLPETVVAHFEATDRPRWAWQDGDLLDPAEPSLHAALTRYVLDLHDDLGARRTEPIVDRMALRLAEAEHFGITPDEMRARREASLRRGASLPDFDVEPLEGDDLVFRICGNGRIALPTRRDGSPALRSGPRATRRWSFPFWLFARRGALQLIPGP